MKSLHDKKNVIKKSNYMKSDNRSKPGHDRWFSVAISNNWATRWRNSAAGMIDWQTGWMFKARLLGWIGRRGGGEKGRERVAHCS